MSKAIVSEPLAWLNVSGINILEERMYLRAIVLTIISLIVAFLELMQLIFNFYDVDVVAGIIEVFAPVFLSLLKVIMFLKHRKILHKIHINISEFWPTNKFTKELEIKLENIFTIVKNMLFSYRLLAMTTTTMIVTLKPILTGSGGLPLDMWQPFDMTATPFYEITYFLTSCVAYFASIINIAVDSLYVGYITHIIAQLILLKHALRNIPMHMVRSMEDEEICWNEMKICIAYHNYLLSLINDIQTSHSFIFFSVFGSGTLCICIDLYSVASDTGPLDVLRLIKYIFQCCFFVFLLFAYCFTGNQLTYQCLSVSDAMYESEWIAGPLPRVRKGVILVIQRSQQLTQLNAEGFLTLDLENFIKMLRLAFSVFTLIRTQTEENKL